MFRSRLANQILVHSTVWIVYFFYENGAYLIVYPGEVSLLTSFFYFILNAIIFYLNYFFIAKIKRDKYRHIKRIIVFIVLAIMYLYLNYMLMQYINQLHLKTNLYTDSLKQFIVLRLFRFVYIISISVTLWIIENKIKIEKQLLELEKKAIDEYKKTSLLEKDKLNAELNFLRMQINPHFLFNTLSFIYTEVLKTSEKASKSILLLSNIMRSAFNETDADDKVTLLHEVKHIDNLIEIHQLRFNHQLNIKFNSPPPERLNLYKITPFILITFVENIFKYADLMDKESPAIINIKIYDGAMIFFTENKKKINNFGLNQDISNKIGISNVQKTLDISYANRYSLNITDQELYYRIDLNLLLTDVNLHTN